MFMCRFWMTVYFRGALCFFLFFFRWDALCVPVKVTVIQPERQQDLVRAMRQGLKHTSFLLQPGRTSAVPPVHWTHLWRAAALIKVLILILMGWGAGFPLLPLPVLHPQQERLGSINSNFSEEFPLFLRSSDTINPLCKKQNSSASSSLRAREVRKAAVFRVSS